MTSRTLLHDIAPMHIIAPRQPSLSAHKVRMATFLPRYFHRNWYYTKYTISICLKFMFISGAGGVRAEFWRPWGSGVHPRDVPGIHYDDQTRHCDDVCRGLPKASAEGDLAAEGTSRLGSAT